MTGGTSITLPEPKPVPGPQPTVSQVLAAADRLTVWADPDAAAASQLAARISRAIDAHPEHAAPVAAALAGLVDLLATGRHAACHVVGCPYCLQVADARAVAAAWREQGGAA